MEDSMMTICQTCGDRGYPEALTYCVKCEVTAEHSYCLGRLPQTLNEDVSWTCQDCLSRVNGHYRFDSSSPTPLSSSDHMCIRSVHTAPARKVSPLLQSVREEASQNDVSDMPEGLDQDSNVHAQPIRDPIWRGSFSINNESFDTVNGLAAHLSSQASPKVGEAVLLLPGSLPLDLLPRLKVLPKRFRNSSITDEDIGLYFFPEKERDELAFDKLLGDIIEGDLAMKAVFDHADLLLFTSRQLPLQNWRYQGKYYLWGLFCSNKSRFRSSRKQLAVTSNL